MCMPPQDLTLNNYNDRMRACKLDRGILYVSCIPLQAFKNICVYVCPMFYIHVCVYALGLLAYACENVKANKKECENEQLVM